MGRALLGAGAGDRPARGAREALRARPLSRARTAAPAGRAPSRASGRRAYRRPLDAGEQASLEAAFSTGEEVGGALAGGLEVLLRVLAESPSFMYVTELGEGGPPGTRIRLDGYETASALSYTLRGGPPDEELLDAARSGALASGSGRAREARRLLGMRDTRYQFRRFVLEWLEVDGLLQTAKSVRLFPGYEALKPHLLAETESFVDEVMVHGGASVRGLLGGGVRLGRSRDGALLRPPHLWPARIARRHRPGRRAPAGELPRGARARGRHQPRQARGLRDAQAALPEAEAPGRDRARGGDAGALGRAHQSPALRLPRRGARLRRLPRRAGRARLHVRGLRRHGRRAGVQSRALGRHRGERRGRRARMEAHRAARRSAGRSPGSERSPSASRARRSATSPPSRTPSVESAFLGLWSHLGEGERDNLFETLLAYVASDLFVLREVRDP